MRRDNLLVASKNRAAASTRMTTRMIIKNNTNECVDDDDIPDEGVHDYDSNCKRNVSLPHITMIQEDNEYIPSFPTL